MELLDKTKREEEDLIPLFIRLSDHLPIVVQLRIGPDNDR